jgi:5-amino-6-(5-phosphoribosylamino)uracil reductase
VPERPYVLLSCAASIDGYIDDTTDQRLLLSNDEDFDRVDEVRASCDAILVGANTIRRDNPRLLVRDNAATTGSPAVFQRAPSRSPSPTMVISTQGPSSSPQAR